MNIQTTKANLINLIAGIQNEDLLGDLQSFLSAKKREYKTSQSVHSLNKKESKLLLKINEGLPNSLQSKYVELNQKLVEEKLTPVEHQELLQLIPQIEAKQVERLSYLIQLAQLWETTVDEVMNRLQIKTPPVAYA
ncbi:MAG: hypothetical protein ACPG49_02450 [Chitinophagales bacterium]